MAAKKIELIKLKIDLEGLKDFKALTREIVKLDKSTKKAPGAFKSLAQSIKEVTQFTPKTINQFRQKEKVLKKYSIIESESINPPKYFYQITKQYHFSTSERYQLHTLLRSWNNLYSKDLIIDLKKINKADLVLKFLKSEIKKGELIW